MKARDTLYACVFCLVAAPTPGFSAHPADVGGSSRYQVVLKNNACEALGALPTLLSLSMLDISEEIDRTAMTVAARGCRWGGKRTNLQNVGLTLLALGRLLRAVSSTAPGNYSAQAT
jgi:hypothetical protein